METPIRVLLVAEDPLVRGGLHALAASQPTLDVVAQVSPEESPLAIAARDPEVIVWESGPDPRATLARLPPRDSEAPPSILLLPDGRFAQEAIAAGARGLLAREVSASALATAIGAVAKGLFVTDAVWEPGSSSLGNRPRGGQAEELTARELEVLQLLAEGLSNKLIAHRLGISDHTAKFHVNAILAKFGAQTRTDAVVRAARAGLLIL